MSEQACADALCLNLSTVKGHRFRALRNLPDPPHWAGGPRSILWACYLLGRANGKG